jgi:hypothetical protein
VLKKRLDIQKNLAYLKQRLKRQASKDMGFSYGSQSGKGGPGDLIVAWLFGGIVNRKLTVIVVFPKSWRR